MKAKQLTVMLLSAAMLMAGCGAKDTAVSADETVQVQENGEQESAAEDAGEETAAQSGPAYADAVQIVLSDDGITVDGQAVSADETAAVYTANDIVYYEAGMDFTYGEGTEEDEHDAKEAEAHTVVHITQPGTYEVSGALSAGQIAVDLGEDAEDDPEAVVTLVLNNADIACTVAPAVIFYEVYECGSDDEEDAAKDVDTSAAGANVIIADGSVNNIEGSYVARIYKSVELNEEGTEVVDSKKLHKYDGTFYSKKSMNVDGGEEGTGVLNIMAENEGLDAELHLTINGGNVNITSGNDGINTNEDGISVTTINGGNVNITVTGTTGEGDGIDSNGWLVINGGSVTAAACSDSADAGIDSDMGIHINGGTVMATGNMLDHISESEQNYAVFSFAENQKAGGTYSLKNENGDVVAECTPQNDFTYLIVSSADLAEGTYTLWMGDTQLAGAQGEGGMGMMPGGGKMPEGMEKPENGEMPERMEMPENGELPEGMELPEGAEFPEGMEKPEDGEFPEGMELPEGAAFKEGMKKPEDGELPEGMEKPEDGELPEGMEKPENGEMPEGMEKPENGEMPEGMEKPEDGEAPANGGKFGGGRGGRGFGGASAEVSVEFAITAGGSYFSNVGSAAE